MQRGPRRWPEEVAAGLRGVLAVEKQMPRAREGEGPTWILTWGGGRWVLVSEQRTQGPVLTVEAVVHPRAAQHCEAAGPP